MTYVIPCNRPNFHQCVPAGRWKQLPSSGGQYEYENIDTLEIVVVPAIRYNQTPQQYAGTLRSYADHADKCARRYDDQKELWSARSARFAREQAAELRAKADIYAASTASTAGHANIK